MNNKSHSKHAFTMKTRTIVELVPGYCCVSSQLPHCNSVVFPIRAQTQRKGCGQTPHYTACKGPTTAAVPCGPLQPP